MDHLGSSWIILDHLGRNWMELGGTGWNWIHMDVFILKTTKNEFSTQFQITIFNQTEIKWPASCVVLLVAFLAPVAELLVGLFGDRHFVALLAVLDVGDSLATTGSGLYYLLNLRHAFADIRGLPLTSDRSHVFLI